MLPELIIIIGIIGLVLFWLSNVTFRIFTYIIGLMIGMAVFFKFFVKKYDEMVRAIIFRMGKFNRVAGPGWSVVIPFFEKEFAKIDVRTHMMTMVVPVAFTNDDLRLKLSGVYYYRIIEPDKAILKVTSYQQGINNLVLSETRNTLASMSMREVFANLNKLNDMLKDSIRHETLKWGIEIDMVQINGITPPEEIVEAMQSKEIMAQQLQAQRFQAEAKKVAIEAIGEAASKLDDFSIMYLYIEALKELSKGQATKLIFPMEFMHILDGMKGDVNSAFAGLNVGGMVNAVKDKILQAQK